MVFRTFALVASAALVVVTLGAVIIFARPNAMNTSSTFGEPAATGAPVEAAKPAETANPAAAARPTSAPTPQPTSGPLAPDFDGGGAWINSAPLRLADLRGKVVLVNFWTYGCYNCQNTLPYEKVWWDKYKDQGLVIVGVHSPEFSSEEVLANVQDAVKRADIGWPVVQDNQHAIWNAYSNRYWPRFYLIDHTGHIIYDHIGEGAYDETDRQIAAALAAARS